MNIYLDGLDMVDVESMLLTLDDYEESPSPDNQVEAKAIRAVLAVIEDDGVEELISDRYFVKYAQEMANDLAGRVAMVGWPFNCIDWEQAAEELKQDYTEYEIDGETWWGR